MADNIIRIDPIYIKYRKMWKENRWKFSGELVRLTIKLNKTGDLNNIERHTHQTMNRIVDEHGGKWTEGYEWHEDGMDKIFPPNKNKKKR